MVSSNFLYNFQSQFLCEQLALFHCLLSCNIIEERCDQLIIPSGLKLGNSYFISPDIDECASSPSPCDQGCSNSAGSYTCSCVPGFRLDNNGKICRGKRN